MRGTRLINFEFGGEDGRGGVTAEDFEDFGVLGEFVEGGVERFGVAGGVVEVDEKEIFTERSLGGARFDPAQVDVAIGEDLQRFGQCTGKIRRRTESQGNIVPRFSRFAPHDPEAGAVVGIVVDAIGENGQVVEMGSAGRGDRAHRRVSAETGQGLGGGIAGQLLHLGKVTF